MKRALLILFALLRVGSGFSQQTKFGLKAGVNFANQCWSMNGMYAATTPLKSFHVQGYADLPLNEQFSVQAGAGVSGKGLKSGDYKGEIMYVEVPANVVMRSPVAEFFQLVFGGGPYAGLKVASKSKKDGAVGSTKEDDFKRGDFGVNLIGGFEFDSGLTLNANYAMGLANVARGKDFSGTTLKNRVFLVSFGFLF